MCEGQAANVETTQSCLSLPLLLTAIAMTDEGYCQMLGFCSIGGAVNICIHTVYTLQPQFYSFNLSLFSFLYFFGFLNFKTDQNILHTVVLIMNWVCPSILTDFILCLVSHRLCIRNFFDRGPYPFVLIWYVTFRKWPYCNKDDDCFLPIKIYPDMEY